MINRVSASGKPQQDLSWLPSKLVRPAAHTQAKVGEGETELRTPQRSEMEVDEPGEATKTKTASLASAPSVPFIDDDEDLGEAI